MAKYRARSCPSCNYYMGFSIAKPIFKSKEVAVTSFCLNCNYRLPMHMVIRGIRKATSPLRRGVLRLAKVSRTDELAQTLEPQTPIANSRSSISPTDYARDLRTIGQDLEHLRLSRFNLECAGDSYLVWPRFGTTDFVDGPHPMLKKNRLQKLLKHRSQSRSQGREEIVMLTPDQQTRRLRYSRRDIDRMEYSSREQRRQNSGVTDGHSLSQLLRTVGALIEQRGERLLGISWMELSISIVVETGQGQRQIDVFRPDNLYDLWVRMYLRRDNRALSDIPR